GGGVYGHMTINTSAGPAGVPPTESLSLSATDIPVGGTVSVNLPASGTGTIARDVWAAGLNGASGWGCCTGWPVTLQFNSAGTYRIGSQAMDSNLGMSDHPSAEVRVGGSTVLTPTIHFSLDSHSGTVPYTVGIHMGTSQPPSGGSISNYFFICGGTGFTP